MFRRLHQQPVDSFPPIIHVFFKKKAAMSALVRFIVATRTPEFSSHNHPDISHILTWNNRHAYSPTNLILNIWVLMGDFLYPGLRLFFRKSGGDFGEITGRFRSQTIRIPSYRRIARSE